MYLIYLISASLCNLKKYDEFSFSSSHQRRFTLEKTDKYYHKTNDKWNIFKKKQNDQGNWFYVHFLTNDLNEVQNYISIEPENQIIKDTFDLFLKPNQIERIANISLIKLIEPDEKYFQDSGPIENNDHLYVKTTNQFELPIKENEYKIVKKQRKDSYVIKLLNKGMSNETFNYKKKLIIEFLTHIPEVRMVTTYKDPNLKNSIMTGFTQKNDFNFKQNDLGFLYLDRYLNDKGLTGKGHTMTIVDTLVDYNHAMFRDDNVQFEINKHLPNHRKIAYYRFPGTIDQLKQFIDENEHGTHVSGIAVGKSICSNDDKIGTSYFNGMAPDSKFIYAGYASFLTGEILGDLMNKYESKVSTNSWGSNDYYSPWNQEYGELAQKYPNLTFLFAAGNEYFLLHGNFSICDPAGSKNVITVGSYADFYIDDDIYHVTSTENSDINFHAFGFDLDDVWMNATYGIKYGESDFIVIDVDAGKQCDKMENNTKYLLYGYDCTWISSCNLNDVAFLYTKERSKVADLLGVKGNILIEREIQIDLNKGFERDEESSTGPANKGILKPDVMGPGDKIISVKSYEASDSPHGCRENGKSDYIFMSGTSMATPNIAGGAVLVQQYFQSDYWIDKTVLDGATTRALIINSCTHPSQTKTPDIMYGHGVVDLSTVLPFNDEFGVQITYQEQSDLSSNLLDESNTKPSVEQDGHVIAKLQVSKALNNKNLQITMSYIDTMLNIDSPIPLTRDLDMILESPSKKIYIGDHLNNNDTQHTSTNEKIIIDYDDLEDGEYKIHVYGGHFTDSLFIHSKKPTQDFAVVASGPIKKGYLKFTKSSECPCEKCDQEHPGFCQCDIEQSSGPVCNAEIETINGNSGSFTVDILGVKRVKFISNDIIYAIVSKSTNPGRSSTIWASPKCHLSLGEYETNGNTNDYFSPDDKKIILNFDTKEICIAIFNNNDREATYDIELLQRPPEPTRTKSPSKSPTQIPTATPTEVPTPSIKPKNKGGSSSTNNSDDNEEKRDIPQILGDFQIQTVYIGSSSIIDFQAGYNLMKMARNSLGHIIPPPNLIHTAMWIGKENPTDESLGAVFVYGKYRSNKNDQTYLNTDGARSYVMSFGEFKYYYDTYEIQKLIPKRNIKLFDFIEEVKSSGNWRADSYNWPTNNCQHFTLKLINIIKAVRDSPNDNDWTNLPPLILKTLKSNEKEEINNIQ